MPTRDITLKEVEELENIEEDLAQKSFLLVTLFFLEIVQK